MKKVTDVDSYIASFPVKVQKQLQRIRQAIRKAAPDAEEVISYQIPAYKFHGMLIFFAGWANHISMYPAPWSAKELQKEMSAYKGSKGTIKFPLDKPVPIRLVSKIVKHRMSVNLEKAEAKKSSLLKKAPQKKAKANSIMYHKNGTVWARGNMKKGKKTGYWEWFRRDGVILRSGKFKDGKQVGEWTTYDKKGKVFKVTKMK